MKVEGWIRVQLEGRERSDVLVQLRNIAYVDLENNTIQMGSRELHLTAASMGLLVVRLGKLSDSTYSEAALL